MTEFKTIETGHPVSSMEINRDGTILIVTYGNEVSFWDTSRYDSFFLNIPEWSGQCT
jgi:translation elongation factor P/translation initiation factor 5A